MMEENLCSLLCVLLRQQRGAGEGWKKSMGGEWIGRHDLFRTRQRRVNVPLRWTLARGGVGLLCVPSRYSHFSSVILLVPRRDTDEIFPRCLPPVGIPKSPSR